MHALRQTRNLVQCAFRVPQVAALGAPVLGKYWHVAHRVETASTTGVQQGGPSFFQRIIVGLQQKFKRCLQLWYLDDGVIAIRFEVLELLLRELGASFQDIGLILNTTNRKLFTIGDPSKFDELSRIPETTDRFLAELRRCVCGCAGS